jgi:hypothetical protein
MLFSSFADFIDNGKNEIGGVVAFSNVGSINERINVFQITPYYTHYLNSSFGFGPILSLFGAEEGATELLNFELGLSITTGINIKNSLLYLSPGCAFIRSPGNPGLGIPINLGIKTIIASHFGIDYTLGYALVISKAKTLNNFGVSIGIFGLL